VHSNVDFFRSDARNHHFAGHGKDLAGELAGGSHSFNDVR
jgi:hypothetical protein